MPLFRKQTDPVEDPPDTESTLPDSSVIKYQKPRILLLDLPEAVAASLQSMGFNVNSGSLGKPYRVEMSAGYEPLIGEAKVPNHSEQEIVVVDLEYEALEPFPKGEKSRPDEEVDLWGKCDRGFLDPRVRSALQLKNAFDRILQSGGVFVVFAAAKTGIHVQFAQINRYRNLYNEKPCSFDEWCFLSELADMKVRFDSGMEMRVVGGSSIIGNALETYLEGGCFSCTLEGGYREKDKWHTIAANKYGDAVGVMRTRGERGTVIVLPQIARKEEFIAKLFSEVLPEISPYHFPDIEKGRWTSLPEYELGRVLTLQAEKMNVLERAQQEISDLDLELEKERAANGWLHELLTGTDAVLVEAVKKSLSTLGFAKVVDVDEERDREGKSRREDLQIQDKSPTLIVDVKGVGGYPSDGDVLQADKHAAIRMREENRTDIVGLSIINHQRHLPPLDRENAMPFRQELLDAAEERTLGLLTAWDLYRFVRNAKRLSWKAEHVVPLFYAKGRIQVVPVHYEFLGVVAKAWTDKFGVVVAGSELRVGDRIAIEFPIEFEELQVDSIRVNDKSVKVASAGDPAGLLWPASAPKLKEGMRVFRVIVPK